MSENDTMLLIDEVKKHSVRDFILIIILIISLVASNAFWIYSYIYCNDTYSESYELEGTDSSNVFYNGQGEVKINSEE